MKHENGNRARCLITTASIQQTGAQDVVASDGFKLVDKSGPGPSSISARAVLTATSVVGGGLPAMRLPSRQKLPDSLLRLSHCSGE